MKLLSFFYSIIISSEDKTGEILKLLTQEKLTDQITDGLYPYLSLFAKFRLSLI